MDSGLFSAWTAGAKRLARSVLSAKLSAKGTEGVREGNQRFRLSTQRNIHKLLSIKGLRPPNPTPATSLRPT
jgi:hypothetical protein